MYSQIDSNKFKSAVLMSIFITFVIGFGYIYSVARGDSTYSGVWFAIIFSGISTLISYYQGDKIALLSSGAIAITETDNTYLYHLVENLCITSGMPMPKIHIMNEPAINAFATGRNPETSSIAVTTGALEKLTKTELEGVLAHELSHIKNYDIRFMTLVAVLVGSISLLSQFFFHSGFGGRRRSDREGSGGGILLIVGIALAILSPIIAELIKFAISRKREYLADASGSLLTRYPEGLAGALEKIKNDNLTMKTASTATAHLFLASPFSQKTFRNLLSTHPPLEDRIKILREMSV